jgi:Kef-type K+ transport system membrane component KefB
MEYQESLILFFGIIIVSGFVFGELANLAKLPKASGYLIAGLLLNPDLTFSIIDKEKIQEVSQLPLNMALSVIAFSIGGGLHRKEIQSLGKSIVAIGVNQAEITLLVVVFGLIGFFSLFPSLAGSWQQNLIPVAIILGALALPTDPAAFLAVKHELKAAGKITTTTLGIAAIDDMLTFLNFVLAISVAGIFMDQSGAVGNELLHALIEIGASIGVGVAIGLLLNITTKLIKNESEGVLIVMMIGFVFGCFGLAELLGLEKLLANMSMGIIVINYNPLANKIFNLLERYTEELVFVIFFALSGIQLNFNMLNEAAFLVILFIVLRFSGKWLGTYSGALIAKSEPKIKKYTTWALLPQGGIVIGLALTLKQKSAYVEWADFILGVVIVSSVFYEIVGPITTKYALHKAGEVNK